MGETKKEGLKRALRKLDEDKKEKEKGIWNVEIKKGRTGREERTGTRKQESKRRRQERKGQRQR